MRLCLALLLSSLIINLFAQSRRIISPIVKQNALTYKFLNFRQAASGCDTVNYPIPKTWTVSYYVAGTGGSAGFVSGNNIYGDQEKAAYFDMSSSPDTYLTKVWIGFAIANSNRADNLSKTVPIKIYDGTSGTPGTLLGTVNKTLLSLHQDEIINAYSEVLFPTAVSLPDSKKIFVAVDLTNLTFNETDGFDSLAIYSNKANETVIGGYALGWEKNKNLWNTLGAGWSVDLSLIIHPFISTNPTCALTSPANITFTGKVYLQGAYNASNGIMNNTLNATGILQANALTQPYNTTAFNYSGAESVTAGFFATYPNIVDWVLVELRDAYIPAKVVSSRAAFVKQDGSLVETDGTNDQITFRLVDPINYFVTIRHRNHLGIRSSTTVDFSSGSGSYDFTTSADNVYQNQSYTSTVRLGNVWALRAGNANSNNNVKYNGPANDQNQILNVKLGGSLSQIISNVYAAEDVNMDGFIKWNGPGNDQNFLLNIFLGGSLSNVYNEQL